MSAAPFYTDDHVTLHHGDCLDVLATLPDASVDAVVTDPPYDLTAGKKGGTGVASVNLDSPYGRSRIGTGNGGGGFMGKEWDSTGVAFDPETWRRVYRVLKPGGHLLAFGGTRTSHRLACAIEDAGFEIRDSIAWLYGSGFPKSLDVSKAIDKAAGAEREVVGPRSRPDGSAPRTNVAASKFKGTTYAADEYTLAMSGNDANITAPATDDARTWQGWGTALKPAHEPIVVARKPLVGSVAANVLTYGTGAINVDACRVGFASEADERESKDKNRHADFGTESGGNEVYGDFSMVPRRNYDPPGRWPANVILDESQAEVLDQQSGDRPGFSGGGTNGAGFRTEYVGGADKGWVKTEPAYFGDSGGASRFFYVAKADAAERPRYRKEGADTTSGAIANQRCLKCGRSRISGTRCECPAPQWASESSQVAHPTVKPLKLMRWLVRLVTPPGGTVLEPFAGSGATVEACVREGFRCIAIEREADYLPLITSRLTQGVLDFGELA